ncbi:hypothetical protein [Actibacterium sp. MT2.3-13A]|uniref:hypothetical protein n=1 Tax=Actibacterium sp. MT2.3-13A TaxID=2828332 RepID=UPI001BAD783A|nr:hypothetical protein [Actibacterium sp. MT2.3-13A]
MRKPLLAVLSAALLLGACGPVRDSRLNPFNWFGRSTEQQVAATVTPGAQPADPRPLVEQVLEMRVEPVPTGAIVHAMGLPPRQGYWKAALVAENDGRPDDKGVLVLSFRAYQPLEATPQGAQPSREITAGLFLSQQDLQAVRTIVVRGAQNQRTSRRN